MRSWKGELAIAINAAIIRNKKVNEQNTFAKIVCPSSSR